MKRMAVVIFALALVGFRGAGITAQQAPQRDAPAAILNGSAVIRGVVVTDDNERRPIRRARVVLTGAPDARATTTDDEGAFAFSGLPAGSYTLVASKPAYLPITFGAKKPGRTGTAIVLADKQAANITMALSLGGVIAGTVRDQRAKPLAGIDVGVVALPLPGAQNPGFIPSPVTTDDRGEYRLFGVPPGQYYVAAVGQNFMTNGTAGRRTVAENDALMAQLQQRVSDLTAPAPAKKPEPLPNAPAAGFAPIYYPGTPRADGATAVTVAIGGTLSGIDFAVVPTRAASIDGTVQGPVSNLDRVELSLVIDGPRFPGFSSSRPILTQPPDARGRFHYDNMPPAHYTILARAVAGEGDAAVRDQFTGVGFASGGTVGGRSGGGGPGAGQEYVYGRTEVDIDGAGVTGASIVLMPGASASGKLTFDPASTPPSDDPTEIHFYVIAMELGSVSVTANTAIGNNFAQPADQTVKADRSWTARGIPPIPGRLGARLPPALAKNWWLRSAMWNGRDLLDSPLDVQPGQDYSGIEFMLTDRHNELSGTLTTAEGKAATDYFIIVLPSDPKLWTQMSRRVKSVRPSSDGKFSVKDLPAGEYSIAALADFLPGEANDPNWLAAIAPAGVKVTINDGAKTVQDLRVGGSY